MRLSDITADMTPSWWWTSAMRRRLQELKDQRLEEERLRLQRFREERAREDERSRSSQPQDDGFVMGLATGIPIPLTPQSILGAAIHDSMTSSPSRSESYSSPEPERYTSSYSSDGGSSSSYDSSSSSSSSSSSFD